MCIDSSLTTKKIAMRVNEKNQIKVLPLKELYMHMWHMCNHQTWSIQQILMYKIK